MHPLPRSLPVPRSHLQTYYSHLLCSSQFSPTTMMPPLCLRPALRQKAPSPEGLSISLFLAALGEQPLIYPPLLCLLLFAFPLQPDSIPFSSFTAQSFFFLCFLSPSQPRELRAFRWVDRTCSSIFYPFIPDPEEGTAVSESLLG